MENEVRIKLRLETSKKSTIFSTFVITFILFIICIILAATITPVIINSSEVYFKVCTENQLYGCLVNSDQEIFSILLKVTKLNQLIYFDLQPFSNETISESINMNYTLIGLEDQTIYNVKKENKNVTISCDNKECEGIEIFYVPYLYYPVYNLILQINDNIPVPQIRFKMTYINTQFSYFEIGIKSFFFAISAVSYSVFLFFIRKIPLRF